MIATFAVERISPYAALLLDAIKSAHIAGASDIHIEPVRDGLKIRFRVLGDLEPSWKLISVVHRQSFLNEAKRVLNLSIAVSGRPQDGRFSYPPLNLDVRVNILPVLYGEKIVLRLLDLGRDFSMNALSLQEPARRDLEEALSQKNGVIIVSGPTGSGKTTTLYTLLAHLNREKLNIVTIEDPVEYAFGGINQVRIDSKVTFSGALRAILRQDPDVILVGEIRDEETAALCFKAASTGHLVLSSLHANSASDVVTRLQSLGVEQYLIKANLKYAAAQRLIKTICPGCRIESKDQTSKSGVTFWTAGNGCSAEGCNRGYNGRVALLEYMSISQIAQFSRNNFVGVAPVAMTLKDACAQKAARGVVDVREVSELA